MRTDYYAVLSLPRNATPAQVRARFLELARERHPDRFQGEERLLAERDFQEITAAFNVLSDPARRRQHEIDMDRPAQRSHDPSQTAKVYMNRGIKAFREDRYLEAADNFHRATQAAPDDPKTWQHLALTCLKETRWLGKGREAIDEALRLRPRDVTFLKLAGRLYAASGMKAQAKDYYNQALRHGGSSPELRQALAALSKPAAEEPQKERTGRFRKLW